MHSSKSSSPGRGALHAWRDLTVMAVRGLVCWCDADSKDCEWFADHCLNVFPSTETSSVERGAAGPSCTQSVCSEKGHILSVSLHRYLRPPPAPPPALLTQGVQTRALKQFVWSWPICRKFLIHRTSNVLICRLERQSSTARMFTALKAEENIK